MKIEIKDGVVLCDGKEVGLLDGGKFVANDGLDKKIVKAVNDHLAALAEDEERRSKEAQAEQERQQGVADNAEAARRRLEAENANLRAEIEKRDKETADKEKADLESENARLRALLLTAQQVPTGHPVVPGATPQRPAPVDINPDPNDPEPERDPELGCLSPGLIAWRRRHWSPEEFNNLYPPSRLSAIKNAKTSFDREIRKRAAAAQARGELTNDPETLKGAGLGDDED